MFSEIWTGGAAESVFFESWQEIDQISTNVIIPATRSTPGEPWEVIRKRQRGRGLQGLAAVVGPPLQSPPFAP